MRTSRSATAKCRMITTVWERCLTCLRMVQITSTFPGAPTRKDKPRITHATAVLPSNSSERDNSTEWFMLQFDVLEVISASRAK